MPWDLRYAREDCAAKLTRLGIPTTPSEAGMKTALVMTGVTDAKTLEASPVRPDHVFDSIANLEGLLREFRQ